MKPAEISISRVEHYHIRTKEPFEWASIVISERGQVFIASDYGDWFYWWSHHGRNSIKHFLIDIERSYLIGKLGGAEKHFNGMRSMKEVRREILRLRKLDDLGKVAAREAWETLEVVEFNFSAETFMQSIREHSVFDALFPDGDFPLCMEPDPGLVMFVERLWPIFVSKLNEELAT